MSDMRWPAPRGRTWECATVIGLRSKYLGSGFRPFKTPPDVLVGALVKAGYPDPAGGTIRQGVETRGGLL